MNPRSTAHPALPQTHPMRASVLRRRERGRTRASMLFGALMVLGLVCSAAFLSFRTLRAAAADPPSLPPPVSLRSVPVPAPPDAVMREYVQDKAALLALGKALYWDTRVGSDNKTACASCHFHAGADNRIRNQIAPGLLAGDKTFQLGAPNSTLTAAQFPLTRHADINDAGTRISDINDIVGSQGVFTTVFASVGKAGNPDNCTVVSDAVSHGGSGFNVRGVNTRRVEPRNAPTVINAIYNFRNFWDGRANSYFNGADPFGLRNENAVIWKMEDGVVREVKAAMPYAALASLSDGPPLSENEMSCRNRSFLKLARKLGDQAPLADQTIAPTDSVLGAAAVYSTTYARLIRKAFQPAYWRYPRMIDLPGAYSAAIGSMDLAPSRRNDQLRRPGVDEQVTQLEANFSMFFGMAMQTYLASLVADDTPYDRYAAGDVKALSAQQVRGFELFRGSAQCMHCHVGAELTSAATNNVLGDVRLDQREGANHAVFHYDNGFFNTGVRPTSDDPGVGGNDPFGYPLSETRISQKGMARMLGPDFHEPPVDPAALTAVDGAFKTPGLRNVEFTGPYFHNGGKATLMQVVDFYNRGGDFAFENQPIPDPAIKTLGLNEDQKRDLVAFLLALSDERVAYQRAPFDHPSICIPHGHKFISGETIEADSAGNAVDIMECLPAVGAGGTDRRLHTFLKLNPYQR
ncbi:MAG: cytochrome c peroxidase [Pseudomonadota bacterium]